MDKDRIKGSAKQVDGTVQESAGKITDNPKLQAKGKARKSEGTLQNAFGKFKDFFRKG